MEAAMTAEPPLQVESRKEIAYLLGEARELEHGLMCEYLYARFSLKRTAGEGLTPEQLDRVQAQLAAGQARRQGKPFTLPELSATLTGISGTSFGARSPFRLTPTCNTGRRDAANLAWNGLPRHRPPGLTCNAQRHGHPGRELRYHRPGKGSSCPPRPAPAGPRICSR
jgi:hypothetical protein